jgi:hypothetical protein
MPHSKENKIEDFAFDYLKAHYASQQGAQNIFVGRSELHKHGIEVEGLFAFRQAGNSDFLASVTFKNSQRIAALLTDYKKKGLSKLRFLTPAIILFFGLIFSVTVVHNVYAWILFTLTAISGFILHTYLVKAYLQLQLEAMLEDFKKYQANEQWLGLSISSLTFRGNKLANYFLKLCQYQGVGVIAVGKRAKVSLLQEPRTHICRHGDYISQYVAEDKIRKAIQVDTILRVA